MSFLSKKRAKKNLVKTSVPNTMKSSKKLGESKRSGNHMFAVSRKSRGWV